MSSVEMEQQVHGGDLRSEKKGEAVTKRTVS